MNILVTGMSGVGKSTLCNNFKQQRYNAFDLDDVPGLCKLKHSDGTEVKIDENRAELNMLETDYVCNTRLLTDHTKAQKGLTFYFGFVDNITEVAKNFDQIILLTVTPEENRRRMSIRTSKDFARNEKTQNELLSYKDEWEDLVQSHGAIVIDASKDSETIAETILKKLSL